MSRGYFFACVLKLRIYTVVEADKSISQDESHYLPFAWIVQCFSKSFRYEGDTYWSPKLVRRTNVPVISLAVNETESEILHRKMLHGRYEAVF